MSSNVHQRSTKRTPQSRRAVVSERLQRLGALEAAESWSQTSKELRDAAAELGARNRHERRVAAALERAHVAEQLAPTPPPSGSRRTRRELRSDGGRYVADLERRHRRDSAWLERHRERCKARGMLAPCPLIPRHVWAMVSECIADDSGRACRIYVSRARNRVFMGAVLRAALGPDELGRARRDFTSERARRLIALGLMFLAMAKVTKRRGRYTGCVSGVTRGAMLAALRNPFNGRQLHVNTLSGIHRRGAQLDPSSGQLGYLPALELEGAFYRQQLPPSDVEAFERFGEWASNRYWIVTADANDGHLESAVRARLQELERLGVAALELPIELRPRPARAGAARPARPAPD